MSEFLNLISSSVVPPSIEDDVTAVKAVKMSPVVLPCLTHGRPQPAVTWSKGGAKLSMRGGSYRVLPTGKRVNLRICSGLKAPHIVLFSCFGLFDAGVLEITAALPSHAGRYTCSARNPAGVAHKHISLTVQGRLYKTCCQSLSNHNKWEEHTNPNHVLVCALKSCQRSDQWRRKCK